MPDPIPQGPVVNVAADRSRGMSLGELARFVQDCLRRDLDPDTTAISVVPTWRKSRLDKITAHPEGT